MFLVVISCKYQQETSPNVYEEGEELSGGGNFTTFDFSENAFGIEGKNLTPQQSNDFTTGNSSFRSNWVVAPSSVQTLDGLGVLFNAVSCGSCHFKDGRAKPPLSPNENLNGLLFRLSIGNDIQGNPIPDPNYGTQLQDKAILGVLPEAKVTVNYQEITQNYPDGTSYTLRKPIYTFSQQNYGNFSPNMLFSPRIAQQICGLGLLENIPAQDILALVDENDTNNDNISGKANMVWDVINQKITLGRFGWKANVATLKEQNAGAFHGDIGITSSIFPQENITANQQSTLGNLPNGGTPEIDDITLEKVSNYTKMLSVPARREPKNEEVLQGKQLFMQLNCKSCHNPSFVTGNNSPISALNNQKIFPYTDLLLHDLGEDLADNRTDFKANGREWRTPPLWGIGMLQTVNKHTFLLHDGRARNIEEAILWHGGEAENQKNAFKNLSKQERNAVIKFLNSL